MSKFSGIFKATIKATMAYRFEMAITLIVAPVQLFVYYYLWKAIFLNTGVESIKGYTFLALMTYYVISWVVGILIYNSMEEEFRWEIRSGSIIKNLLKPLNYLLFNFFIALGDRALAVLIEIIPLIIIGFVFFSMTVNLTYLPFFILSAVLALIINYLLSSLVGMSAFWLIHNRGVTKIKRLASLFISGGAIPLTFFPLWFQKFSYFLPFQYISFIPTNIWLGQYNIGRTLVLLGFQFIWVIVLYVFCQFIWYLAMKKLSTVGV
jgi:ABC-2 type transport system permease protein